MDLVRIGGLRQIVEGPHLHRGDRGRDVAVAGEDDAAGIGTPVLEALDHVEPVAVAEPHVDHGKGRRLVLDRGNAVSNAFGHANQVAAAFHGAGEAGREGPVVVDDQETLVGAIFERGRRIGHQTISLHLEAELLEGVNREGVSPGSPFIWEFFP